ncbi:hypothetical protein PsorP6_004563 [Peronosclerospora sorghi]|uniref:Uncharacterized protein n=1 Tax=Peronosclerospora sorghi TaxID=230839 RepID=A0ACC0VPS5_9STRA|nr:hypothetical protein PsorP6_004563 [Peronosclerospora sorghi]
MYEERTVLPSLNHSELRSTSSSHSLSVLTQERDVQMAQGQMGRPPPAALHTCLQSTTRWFQLVMFFAFVFALVMAMISKYDNLSPGLIWGGILSIFSVFFVILSYVSVPNYRQHPNPLVFWRTIADAVFVMQLMAQQFIRCIFFECVPLCSSTNLQCGCSTAQGASSTCSIFAGLFEFTLLASECWFFCMTANLLMSLTNPFTDFKRNTRMFHLGSWFVPLFLGLMLMNTDDWAGYSDLGVCWTNALKNLKADSMTHCPVGYEVTDNFSDNYRAVNANIISWFFFYIWMGLFIVFGIAVWVWAWKRLSEGMPETYAIRVQSINRARFNVFAVTFYWIIVVIVYIKFLSRDRAKPDKSSELLNFLIAGKGYLDLSGNAAHPSAAYAAYRQQQSNDDGTNRGGAFDENLRSWVNRHGDLPKRGKKVTCRHCNRKYIYQNSAPENANCTVRLGGHEPNVVLKDSDLTQKLNLDRDVALELYQQLCADSQLLCSFGIMDYSLLMGINEVEYVVDEGTGSDDETDVSNVPMQSTAGGEKGRSTQQRISVMENAAGSQNFARSKGPAAVQSASSKPRGLGNSSSSTRPNTSRAALNEPMMPRKASKPLEYSNSRSRNGRAGSNTSSSGRRLPRSGMRMANTVVGPAYYHLGVIDILQTWTLKKRMERFFKIAFKGVDGDGLSAIPPKLYQARFQLKMADILGIDDLVNGDQANMDLFTQQNSHMDVDTQQADRQYSIQSIRSLASSELVAINAMDSHYTNSRSSSTLRQRSTENSQSVGQDTEEYTGIDYHL